MCSARLFHRVGACRTRGTARLAGHALRFHKRSVDGSAKCDAFATGRAADAVLGALYEVPEAAMLRLDAIEGVGAGYRRADAAVATAEGPLVEATLYLALDSAIDPGLSPYSWYADFVRRGAAEHGLPADYIARFIDGVAAVADPDAARERTRRAEVVGADSE